MRMTLSSAHSTEHVPMGLPKPRMKVPAASHTTPAACCLSDRPQNRRISVAFDTSLLWRDLPNHARDFVMGLRIRISLHSLHDKELRSKELTSTAMAQSPWGFDDNQEGEIERKDR
ncbi:uncharacterized protein G2W53_003340 [Senna tora]|uniref:Uncharacterized protein n=1 Tax=Senna tora TaxID=362788 RepID=A0A834XAW2_9FABA|nr:uncharacterized protein G2W53_003340 [Senna tora]